MIYAAVYLVFFSALNFDLVFCDQISACIPVLRLSKKKVLFYCHFPDMLLTHRKSALKRLYRLPIDWLEEKTTGMADRILVNSKFTGNFPAYSTSIDFKCHTLSGSRNCSVTLVFPFPLHLFWNFCLVYFQLASSTTRSRVWATWNLMFCTRYQISQPSANQWNPQPQI